MALNAIIQRYDAWQHLPTTSDFTQNLVSHQSKVFPNWLALWVLSVFFLPCVERSYLMKWSFCFIHIFASSQFLFLSISRLQYPAFSFFWTASNLSWAILSRAFFALPLTNQLAISSSKSTSQKNRTGDLGTRKRDGFVICELRASGFSSPVSFSKRSEKKETGIKSSTLSLYFQRFRLVRKSGKRSGFLLSVRPATGHFSRCQGQHLSNFRKTAQTAKGGALRGGAHCFC